MNKHDIIEIIMGILVGCFVFGIFNDDQAMVRKRSVDGDKISTRYFMSGGDTKVNSTNFEGGRVNAFMGGGKIDLTNATLAKENHLKVSATMGGVEIVVPKDWQVELNGTGIMGGVEGPSNDSTDVSKTLRVSASAFMGGVHVRRTRK